MLVRISETKEVSGRAMQGSARGGVGMVSRSLFCGVWQKDECGFLNYFFLVDLQELNLELECSIRWYYFAKPSIAVCLRETH